MFNYFSSPTKHKFGQHAAGLLTGLCFSINASAQISATQEHDVAAAGSMRAANAPIGQPLPVTDRVITTQPPNQALMKDRVTQ